MQLTPTLLAAVLTGVMGCSVALIPVFIVERIEGIHPRTTTQPWHFEGQKVVYDTPEVHPKAEAEVRTSN